MLLGFLGIWTLFALAASVAAFRARKRLKRWLWMLLAILWSPWLLLLLAIGLFVLGEHLRSVEMASLTPESGLQRQLEEGFAGDPRALLQDGETVACLCYSYGVQSCLSRELPAVADRLNLSLPAEDGMWYAIFLADDVLSRVYLIAPDEVTAGCWQREH